MENPIDHFWKLKLENVKEALESNNFKVFIADNSSEVTPLVKDNILSSNETKSLKAAILRSNICSLTTLSSETEMK